MVVRAGCDGEGGLSLGVIGFGAATVIAEAHCEQVIHLHTPSNGDATELPYFSFLEQIRPGSGVVLDRIEVGYAVRGMDHHDWLRSGPRKREAHGAFRHFHAGRDILRSSCPPRRWRSRSTASTM